MNPNPTQSLPIKFDPFERIGYGFPHKRVGRGQEGACAQRCMGGLPNELQTVHRLEGNPACTDIVHQSRQFRNGSVTEYNKPNKCEIIRSVGSERAESV